MEERENKALHKLASISVIFIFGVLGIIVASYLDKQVEVSKKQEELNWALDREETNEIKNIRFTSSWDKGNNVMFDTDEGTVVMSAEHVHYYKKTDKASSLNLKIFKQVENRNGNALKERAVTTLLINQSDVKKISNQYAETFEETLILGDEKNESSKLQEKYIDLSEGWDEEE